MISGVFGIGIIINSLLTVIYFGPFASVFASVVGNVVLTYLGFKYFKDVEFNFNLFVGLAISFSGSIYFTYSKYQ